MKTSSSLCPFHVQSYFVGNLNTLLDICTFHLYLRGMSRLIVLALHTVSPHRYAAQELDSQLPSRQLITLCFVLCTVVFFRLLLLKFLLPIQFPPLASF
jgi:hypothetical protein